MNILKIVIFIRVKNIQGQQLRAFKLENGVMFTGRAQSKFL